MEMLTLKTNEWKIENIDTILFDKDGTFIDLHYFWGKMTELRAKEVIKRFSLSDDYFNQICLILGYDLKSQKMLSDGITAMYSRVIIIEIFNKKLNELGAKSTEKEIEEIFDYVSTIFYQEMEKYTKPITSAISFIQEIRKKGIKTGIVTSDSKESTDYTLKHFGWENLFDVVVGRESTKETKESGIPVKLALDTLKSNPQNTIMIGDAPMDEIAAKNAGVEKTILVATGQILKDELKHTSPYTVNTLEEVEIL